MTTHSLMFDEPPLATEKLEVTRVAAMHRNSRVQGYRWIPSPVLERIVVLNRSETVAAAVRTSETTILASSSRLFVQPSFHDQYFP